MKKISIKTDPMVEQVYRNYPKQVREQMKFLRKLIIETAKESEEIDHLEETLKWGEPSFITKQGSTLRIDWKEKSPDQYAMYFNCQSRLIDTFKSIFDSMLKFEGNRAILFAIEEDLPIPILKECIKASLIYHKVKHLPNLGI